MDYKKNIKKILILLVIGISLAGSYFIYKKIKDPVAIYDVVIQVRDQKNPDPVEDARSSMKIGDVVAVRETGSEWSQSEKIGFLILKMKLKKSQVGKLTMVETKKLNLEEAKAKKIITDEMVNNMTKEEMEERLIEDVRARKYRINVESLGFEASQLKSGQPFADQEFDWSLVVEKTKK